MLKICQTHFWKGKMEGILCEIITIKHELFFEWQAFQFKDGSIENEANMLGHVGIYSQDAPRVCGGKNTFGQLDTCYELNTDTNRFIKSC